MKSNKIVLSLAMVMSLVAGSYGTISINAVGNYIGDDDLSNTETPAPASWGEKIMEIEPQMKFLN